METTIEWFLRQTAWSQVAIGTGIMYVLFSYIIVGIVLLLIFWVPLVVSEVLDLIRKLRATEKKETYRTVSSPAENRTVVMALSLSVLLFVTAPVSIWCLTSFLNDIVQGKTEEERRATAE